MTWTHLIASSVQAVFLMISIKKLKIDNRVAKKDERVIGFI